jgi:hypothetical protein
MGDSPSPPFPFDAELSAVYAGCATDEEAAPKLSLLLALRAWRLISIAHGDGAPLDKSHPFGDSHLHKIMASCEELSIADSTSLFVAAVSDFRNVCVEFTKMLRRNAGALPINFLADGTALDDGCAGLFDETWHQVAAHIAFSLLQIVDKVVPRGRFLIGEKARGPKGIVPGAEMVAALPEKARPHAVIITSEMRVKVYDAIKRSRLTVFNIEQLHARMTAECRRASSFQSLAESHRTSQSGAETADTRKKSGPLMPDSADVRDLCALLAKRHKSGKSLNQIAREFTHGNVQKANSLLRQSRRFRHLWDSSGK